jgi:hypothetical protein
VQELGAKAFRLAYCCMRHGGEVSFIVDIVMSLPPMRFAYKSLEQNGF